MERLEALIAQQQATPPLRRKDLETTLDQVRTLALPRSRCTVGLLSLPRTQRGSVSQRLAKVCCLAPGPRPDQRVSRPAAGVRPVGRTASRPARGGPGGRWRGGRRARLGRAPQREGGWGTDAVRGKGRVNFPYSPACQRLPQCRLAGAAGPGDKDIWAKRNSKRLGGIATLDGACVPSTSADVPRGTVRRFEGLSSLL
jgi:hypothetical protein